MGDVGDVAFTEEREEILLTERSKRDVSDENDAIWASMDDGFVKEGLTEGGRVALLSTGC